MNGREFIDSAGRLAMTGRAADARSAISRAYYAAFHAVRDFFSDCGIRFSEHSPEAHAKMPQCLDNSNVPMAMQLAGQLRSLREDRNGADYRMTDVQFETTVNAQLRIRIAAWIIAAVDALYADPTARTCAGCCGQRLALWGWTSSDQIDFARTVQSEGAGPCAFPSRGVC